MPSTGVSRVRASGWQYAAFGLCVAFGLAMIANIQVAGDGVWYWYASFVHGGQHLYSGMHLPLQPLFVLETSWFMALFGKSWLAFKVPAVLHVVAYVLALLLIVRQSKLTDGQRAIVLSSVFFLSIFFEAYRFDDYHVLADCFQLYSIVALLVLARTADGRRIIFLALGLGVLSGLAITTRLNDGAALFVGAGIALICLVRARRGVSVVLFVLTTFATVAIIVRLTGDTFHDYAVNSIIRAAGSKGGTGSVLAYPIHLPLNTLHWLRDRWYERVVAYSMGICLVWGFLLRPLLNDRSRANWIKAGVGAILVLAPLPRMYGAFLNSHLILSLSAVATLCLYAVGVLVSVRFVRWAFSGRSPYEWDRRQILFLIPLGQLASGSMSSGGMHLGLYAPIAVFMLLLPVVSPVRVTSVGLKSSMMAMAVLVGAASGYYKTIHPYLWHSYLVKPLFTDREWYHHPVYGPMVIERDQLAFIEPVCREVLADGPHPDLLSLPFPFANYFCAVAPWHGYVQTFFDTSTKQTIDGLMSELETSPPTWILYQRQLDNLKMHEHVYNHDLPLPHRALDEMIESKIANGTWKVVSSSSYESRPSLSNEWLLLRTK